MPRIWLVILSAALLIAPAASATTQPSGESREWIEPYEGAPYETDFKMDDPEVTQYAAHYGISPERSLQIANWMLEAGPVLEGFESELNGNYANVRVVHGGGHSGPLDDSEMAPGELRVEVRLKNPDHASATSAVGRIPTDEGVSVDLRKVPKSLVELQREAADLWTNMAPGQVGRVIFDYDSGEVRIEPDAVRSGYTKATCAPSTVTGGSLDGARPATIWGPNCNSYGECTSGFPARFNGVYGYLTAGHCLDDVGIPAATNGRVNGTSWRNNLEWVHDVNDIYVSARSYWYRDDTAVDVGFANRRYASTDYPGRLWKWDTGEWRRIEHYSYPARGLGLTICIAASNHTVNGAGTYCGLVSDQHINPYGGISAYWTEYDAFQAPFGEDVTPKSGASGAPAWYGDTVYGIYTGHVGNQWGYYYRAGIAELRMEQVYSGNDTYFLCWNGSLCEPN